nr:zonadhesin-like protein 9 [Limnephilus flavicornis]
MKAATVLLLVACSIATASGGYPTPTEPLPTIEEPEFCTPGTTKKVECNDCFCTEDGGWVCTEKYCLKITTERPSVCTPGSTTKIECNTCVCTNDGQWACTRMGCPKTTQVPTIEEPELCTPGTTKKVECNDCVCTEDGGWACTEKYCLKITTVSTTEKPKLCTPGTTKKIDCNDCFCTKDGGWACTKMLCPETTPAPPTKKPLVCGANEVREECYNPCPSDKCADIGRLEKCVVIEEKDCKPGCRCALHFRRNKAGVCIDTRKCPAQKCKSGEFWDHDCSATVACDDERCIKEPSIACISMEPLECIPRCQCKDKRCRNESGTCIKKGCKGDPNAVCVKCGDPCPITCRNKDVFPRKPCALPCKTNGCKCVSGFVLDDEGFCIPRLKCPEICVNPNEEFKKCRADQYCTGILAGEEVILPRPDVCKPNCRCKKGYVRDYNNICIRPEECCKEPDTKQP